jgi:hypothetical protein
MKIMPTIGHLLRPTNSSERRLRSLECPNHTVNDALPRKYTDGHQATQGGSIFYDGMSSLPGEMS